MVKTLPKIDVHIHLAGTGCCNSGIFLSQKFASRYTFRILKFLYKISNHQMQTTIDHDWPELISLLIKSSMIDYGVVLGFDGVYDQQTGNLIKEQSQMMIPPQWVFNICKQKPGLLPGPSINPHKKNALRELEYCLEQGAVLIKWLPCVQAISPEHSSLKDFYKLAASVKIPLLIHMGGERTFATIAARENDVRKLIYPLEAGVPVICAHTATPILAGREPDQIPPLIKLLQTYPHLWVDNSGLCNPARFHNLKKIVNHEIIKQRTLYGSDFPVPSNAFYFIPQLGVKKVLAIEHERNLINRDIKTKLAFGYPETMLTQAQEVLINLDRWLT